MYMYIYIYIYIYMYIYVCIHIHIVRCASGDPDAGHPSVDETRSARVKGAVALDLSVWGVRRRISAANCH